ncbi:TonB-dependent receptor [Carboxylicivirga sp. M1479]|uniref:SusC/RagA family TonB-linked outer membrane protein n=1 Tax=Carboxylicivirga sp. M1479 TaxID=2594476 RepID=UPI0011779E3A|nr:TonB-dependent receptor [Carboxylicivirga sp. M1479]TRX70200.1 TonB-dependent receptor [Carboxylicivirga sp. M1479]
MKKTIILLTVLLGCFQAFAQKQINGIVTDTSGETIPGVNITVKGTTQGVITDMSGAYTIEVEEGTTLVFSFIGFETVEKTVGVQSTINVVLKSEMLDLEEVVVVGYGEMRKSDLTGSVSSVKLFENNAAGASVDKLLQGRTSGVHVSTASSEPGANVNVRIRGVSSLSVSNQPLYVIDGIPFDIDVNTPSSMGETSSVGISPLISLNPNDIANIEILKDASATAIYGSRASNGVILITTKSGKKGKSEITYSSSISLSQAAKHIDVLSPQEYAQYLNDWELARAEVQGDEANPPYNGEEDGLPLPEDVVGYNWQDELLRTAFSHEHNIGISGANELSNYYVSLGVAQSEGIMLNSSLDRYSFSGKYDLKLNERLKTRSQIAYTHASGQGTSTSGDSQNTSWTATSWMLSKSPVPNANDYDGDDYIDPELIESPNPLSFVNEYVSHPTTNTLRGNMSIDYEIFKWLTFQSKFGLNYAFNKKAQYWPSTLPMVEGQGRAGYSTSEQLTYTWNNLMHFKFNINKDHVFSGVAGTETSKAQKEYFKVRGDGFSDDDLTYWGLENASIFTPADFDKVQSTLFSVLARMNYNYKDRYLLTVTGRYDGSSKFSESKKFGFFPSASVAWRISQENFLKDNSTISNLKLRLGWGQVGNQGLPPYSTLSQYGGAIYPYGGVSHSGYLLSDFEKDITWEISEQLNAGIDIGLFENRFMASVDVYEKLSKDLLIKRNIPLTSGFTTAWTNMGEIQNRGVDVELNARVMDGAFKWDLGGNFSLYRNKISNLGLPESDYGYSQYWGKTLGGLNEPVNTFIEGEAIGLFWGYKTDGLFQTQEEVDALNAHAVAEGTGNFYQFEDDRVSAGDIKYVDLNGDGVVNEKDKTIIGNPNPDFTYGINSTFTYKGFTLNAFFQGVQGVDVFNHNLQRMTKVAAPGTNVIVDAYKKAWTGEGTSNYYPRLQPEQSLNELKASDRLIEDGSYLRLQNVSLAYNVPVQKIQWLKQLNVSVTGTNLFTLTDYSWYNPETNIHGDANDAIGIDRNSYPMAQSVIFSLRLTL